MKDLIKEYKTQIAIIVGALIVAFSIYFSMTYEVRTKINKCIEEKSMKSRKPERVKDWCTSQVLKFGRW